MSQYSNKLFIYDDSHNVGYIESMMNGLIFAPPDKEPFTDILSKPKWLKYIILPNTNKLSYFVIDPIEDSLRPINKHSDKKYILWSHGNAGDLLDMYPFMKTFHKEINGKLGIIIYDYEGYGYSDGVCSEKTCYNDLTCMVHHSLTVLGIQKRNLFLIGQSLGTGIVVDFCYKNLWTTPIILISPYKSISRVKLDPHWTNIISNIIVNSIDMFTTHYKLDDLKCPIIIYHGLDDEMIPASHSIEMYNNHTDKIKLILVENATHNDILDYVNASQILNMITRISK